MITGINKFWFVFSLILLCACSTNSEVKNLIKDYEQIVNGVKTDLNLKIVSLDKFGKVSNNDSLKYYFEQYKKGFDKDIADRMTLDSMINRFSMAVITFKELNKSYNESMNKETSIELKEFYLKLMIEVEKNIHNDSVSLIVLKKYSTNKDSIIGNIYKCKYTIHNPFLNNVKQEIEKTYVVSTDNKLILGTIIN